MLCAGSVLAPSLVSAVPMAKPAPEPAAIATSLGSTFKDEAQGLAFAVPQGWVQQEAGACVFRV